MDEKHLPEGHPKPAHETSDANTRSVVIFGVVLFVTLVASLWLVDVVFHYFTAHQHLGPPLTPYGHVRELPPPGVPRLEVHPGEDMEHYREQQEKLLNSYGWVDRDAGTVRIPIQRAMDLLLQKGLPVRTGPPQQGIVDPIQEDHLVPKGYMPQN
jgi:hypothetical protein